MGVPRCAPCIEYWCASTALGDTQRRKPTGSTANEQPAPQPHGQHRNQPDDARTSAKLSTDVPRRRAARAESGTVASVSDDGWREIAERQAGVITRSQLLGLGLTPRQARRWLDSGRWRQVHAGVYVTFTGPIGDQARVWAAVLAAGPGAVAGCRTALWLCGVLPELPSPVEVCIPHGRQVRGARGVRVHRRRYLEVHPAALPPRVRLETAVLDVADREDDPERAIASVLRPIQQRRVTAERLAEQLRR